MAKKSRSARKAQRQRAVRAQERGLPVPTDQSEESAREESSFSEGGRRPAGEQMASGSGVSSQRGLPTIAKVLLGAAVVLVLLFLLSQLRK